MDEFKGLPSWIKVSKKSLKQTQEWQTFMMKLYDLVHHQMQELGVGSFNDLAPPERQLLLQRGFQALKTSDTYLQLLNTVSETLDESVNKEADKQSLIKQQNKTKIEILQDECHNAVTSLLQRWPDSKTSLRHCLNADIPFQLRYVMWKNFLKHPRAREDYLKIVTRDPKKLVSRLDFEIAQKCQTLLESDPTLKQIPNKKDTTTVMRHLLSYRHTKSNSRGGLMETDYLLAIPFVVCTLSMFNASSATNAQQQPLTTEALVTLTEEYWAFMEKRPDYMKSTHGPSLTDLAKKTSTLLRKTDSRLASAVENYKVSQRQVNDADTNDSRLQYVLAILLHPLVKSMFVGYCPLETVFHAWDLIVIGFDNPTYDPVPYICSTLLVLLSKDLSKCQSEKEAESTILRGCRNISEERLKLAINQLGFETQLRKNLDVSDEFPVFHPALKSNLPPWKQWYSSKIISHIQDDRHSSRRKPVVLPSGPHESPSTSTAGGVNDEMWRLEQEKLELEEVSGRLKEEREILLAEIEEERRLRIEIQERADEEIERLRRQLHASQKVVPIPVPSPPKPATPPPQIEGTQPSPRQPTPVEPKIETPEPEPPEEEATDDEIPKVTSEDEDDANDDEKIALEATNDFLKKMMDGISALAQGTGKTRKELDQMTRKDYSKYNTAMANAQAKVFGKRATLEDIQRLSTPEKNEKLGMVKKEVARTLFKIK